MQSIAAVKKTRRNFVALKYKNYALELQTQNYTLYQHCDIV